jgi:signal transduction histidine kinase
VQKLFAALAQLTLLHLWLSDLLPEQPEILATLQRASELLESALSDIRNLLSTFRTPEFTHRKLDQIIEDLIVQFETLTGLKVNLVQKEVPEGIALPVKIAVYRIVQEALSNVYRHAGVNEAWVSLYQQGEPPAIGNSRSGSRICASDRRGRSSTARQTSGAGRNVITGSTVERPALDRESNRKRDKCFRRNTAP